MTDPNSTYAEEKEGVCNVNVVQYPKIPTEKDKRKKLTVRKMIKSLIEYGFSYREMAEIFEVSYTLFSKYKIPLNIANKKRYLYKINKDTAENRKDRRTIQGESLLRYERQCKKKSNNKNRKNIFSPRLTNRKNK